MAVGTLSRVHRRPSSRSELEGAGAGLAALEPRLRSLLPAELYARAWLQPDAENLSDVFVHLRALWRILTDQIPLHVADAPPAVGAVRSEWQSGTLMFTDLAGFTPFIEANARGERSDAEMVHAVLNRYFSDMIDIFGSAGGNLLEFTGDAMLIRFAADHRGNDVYRAVNAGLRMQRAMHSFESIDTPGVTTSLGMRIGIHVGRFLAADVGTPRRRDHVLFGEAVRRTKAAEGAGAVGRVALTPEAMERVDDRFVGERAPGGHVLVVDDLDDEELAFYDINPRARRQRAPLVLDHDIDAVLQDIDDALALVEPLATYVPRPLLDVMVETAHDRRIPMELTSPTVFFVKLEGLDRDLESADDARIVAMVHEFSAVFAQIDAAVTARRGMVRKVTYQASGSDVLVCFGVLDAHVDDPHRAADAALVVRDGLRATTGAGVTCRIGAAQGSVFAAEIGATLGRREFNLVGDPVNVAARLTARARPGTIVVTDTLAAMLEPRFTVRSMGRTALKGKSGRMEVFELVDRC